MEEFFKINYPPSDLEIVYHPEVQRRIEELEKEIIEIQDSTLDKEYKSQVIEKLQSLLADIYLTAPPRKIIVKRCTNDD